jgi:hypothetical protein
MSEPDTAGYFAILDQTKVVPCEDEGEARSVAKAHLAKGHPAARSASVYEAPSEAMLRQVVLEKRDPNPVRFIYVGIPRNYYDSEEWKAEQAKRKARRLADGAWDCTCGEECENDMSYCPSCGRAA